MFSSSWLLCDWKIVVVLALLPRLLGPRVGVNRPSGGPPAFFRHLNRFPGCRPAAPVRFLLGSPCGLSGLRALDGGRDYSVVALCGTIVGLRFISLPSGLLSGVFARLTFACFAIQQKSSVRVRVRVRACVCLRARARASVRVHVYLQATVRSVLRRIVCVPRSSWWVRGTREGCAQVLAGQHAPAPIEAAGGHTHWGAKRKGCVPK